VTVVMLGGRKGAGKDEVADFLVESRGYVKVGMSDPLLELLLLLNPIVASADNPDGPDFAIRASDAVAMAGYVEAKQIPEFRRSMTALGTDVIRNQVDVNFFAKKLAHRVQELQRGGRDVVVTGVRFANELETKRLFGDVKTFWVSRPGHEVPDEHESETSLNASHFDDVILNNGSIADLHAAVNSRL
jgi:hypothetical protein